MTEKKNGNCWFGIIVGIIIVLILIGSCSNNSKSSSYSTSKYSDDYKNNSSYREDVNYIADVYGEDPADVDRMINAVADAMN